MAVDLGLEAIYQRRFGRHLVFRRQMWKILCTDFFQRYIPIDSTVMEIGAGYCEFINNIHARSRIAVDLNPDTRRLASPDVKVILSSSVDLSVLETDSVNVAFASNFFEHLSRDDILCTMKEVARVLAANGRFLILQPNIRFCYRDYWMFFDHVTPLDDRSLTEALEISGFKVVHVVPRFLPYTTESRLPKSPFFVKAYLHAPIVWRFLGAQTFVVAEVARNNPPQSP
jgi:SAM-dependent methyltransferase